MKSVSTILRDHIRQAYNVYCKPKLIAEWNLNRYGSPVATNGAPEDYYGYNVDLFPIESIIEPNRPGRGIAKAFVNQARVGDYSTDPATTRFYVANDEDIYKYWVSPVTTSGTTFPVYNQTFATPYERTDSGDGLTVARPTVTYASAMQSNKIVIGLENSFASPTNYTVYIKTTPAGAWTSIASNPTIGSDGRINLYWTGSAWTTTAANLSVSSTTAVAGIQLRVGGMTVSNSFLSVIEISARRVADLTDRLIESEMDMDIASDSLIYPIGTITTNSGSLSLSNIDSIFDADEVTSPYYGILEPNVEFTLSYIYNINGTNYEVQEFKMFGGPWAGQKTDTINMECFDYSKYFQEMKTNRIFYTGLNVSEIVWRICDQVGFNNYVVTNDSANPQIEIPYFWADGEQTVWEIFDELARATQTAIYFDSYGKLNIKSRSTAFNKSAAPVWTLRGETLGNELADIVELEQVDEVGTNHVTVVYQKTEFPEDETGFPVRESVWEPETNMVLRATNLMSSITSGQMTLKIDPNDAKLWPFEGIMQIEGELIKYRGKKYISYGGGSQKINYVSSIEEQRTLDTATPSYLRYMNHYTGDFQLTERGAWNSEPKAHYVDLNGYTVKHYMNGSYSTGVNGFSHTKTESTARLTSTSGLDSNGEYLWAIRGSTFDSPFYHYGTRIRFNSTNRMHQRAGIAFNLNGGQEDGYYIQIVPTNFWDGTTLEGEVTLYSRKNGTHYGLGNDRTFIKQGTFFDLEVSIRVVGINHYITVYLNGVKVIGPAFVSTTYTNSMNGRFGMFIRGSSDASFEYLYAVRRTDREMADESTWWDRIRTAYSSTQWDREWVFDWRSTSKRIRRSTGKERYRWNKMFMDEFGPIIHEVREFDVKFDPSPVLDSRLFISNGGIMCPEYIGDSFGAKFTLTNASRKNAVAHGDDTLAYAGSGEAVNRVLFCYGRVAKISDAEEVVVKNDQQIQARGKVETEVTSSWIQTKVAATLLAEWIEDHWSQGAEVLNVTIFGNPLLELTDVVDVAFDEYNMTPATHKYFVTGISTDFSQGLQTVLKLRRLT